MSMKDAYVEKVQARLNAWDSEIEGLKAKTNEASADAKIAFEKQILELKEQQKNAQEKLDEVRQSSDDAWSDMKVGVESAWMSLQSAVESASKRFNA